MRYKRLFERIKCHILVIFDDEFINRNVTKKRVIRDFSVMDSEDQSALIGRIRTQNTSLADSLCMVKQGIDSFFERIDWENEIPLDDFEVVFSIIEKLNSRKSEEIKGAYDAIDEEELKSVSRLLMQYGLGVSIPDCYLDIFEDYETSNGRRGKLRIYCDFTAETQASFKEDIKCATNERTVICIVDNCLTDQYKAREILDCIVSMDENIKNVIGTVFTSKQNVEPVEQIDERLCFVCTNKATPEQLSMNILRSAYHYFLSELQSEVSENVRETFKKAKKNKYIANFLSQRAGKEGISDYEVIQNWLRLMYEVRSDQSNATKRLISLARIIDELDGEDDVDLSERELIDQLNTKEIFDYHVNEYHLPTMPGDLFIVNDNELFVLIGQDCEMMMAESRQRRVAVTELLPIKLIPMSTSKKIDSDLGYAWIANYEHVDNQVYCMQVDYKKRKHIDGRILDLCIYNPDGECCTAVEGSIDKSIVELLQPYLIDYYENLHRYFGMVGQLKESSEGMLQQLLANDQYLLTTDSFEQREGKIHFPIRRVCRLRQTYVFYLYKLFLEYRGRQPFETINYAASSDRTIEVNYQGNIGKMEVRVKLGSYSDDSKIEKLSWFIKKEELRKLIKSFGITGKIDCEGDTIVLEKKVEEISLKEEKPIQITKKKNQKAELKVIE